MVCPHKTLVCERGACYDAIKLPEVETCSSSIGRSSFSCSSSSSSSSGGGGGGIGSGSSGIIIISSSSSGSSSNTSSSSSSSSYDAIKLPEVRRRTQPGGFNMIHVMGLSGWKGTGGQKVVSEAVSYLHAAAHPSAPV